jgi:pilus assembly protein CpaE
VTSLYESRTGVQVAIVDPDPRVRERVAALLGDRAEIATYPSVDAFEIAFLGDGCVVLLGPSYAVDGSVVEAQRLQRPGRQVAPILLVDELTTATLQAAMRAGVRDVVLTSDLAGLEEALTRVSAALVASIPPVPTLGGGYGSAVGAPVNRGRAITVFSTKGGAGKSMMACNLALVLARRSEKPVVLLDADLQFGDVAVMLKIAPQTTIVDVVQARDRLDVPLLQSLLVRHPSGLLVLPAPIDPSYVDQVPVAALLEVLDLLRSFCSYVVIDTPAQFSEVNLSLLEACDDILLIAGLDIPNIKNVKPGLQTLKLLNTPLEKIHLVLNRANSKVKLETAEVERTLGLKAESLVPSDIVVPQTVNKGIPAVIDAPKSGVAKAIEALADRFLQLDRRR